MPAGWFAEERAEMLVRLVATVEGVWVFAQLRTTLGYRPAEAGAASATCETRAIWVRALARL